MAAEMSWLIAELTLQDRGPFDPVFNLLAKEGGRQSMNEMRKLGLDNECSKLITVGSGKSFAQDCKGGGTYHL